MATSSATTRHGAARLTRGSQIATIALAGLAAAAFIFGIPGSTPEKPIESLTPPKLDPIRRPQAAARGPAPDLVAVADRFSTIANAPKPPPPAPVADTTLPGGPGVPPPVAPPVMDNIKYIGHVGLGATLFAMVNENQRQQVVGINDELEAGRVVEITPSELTLDRDGTRKVIELAAKSGSAISTVLPINAATRGIRGGPRGQINPEDLMARSRSAPRGPTVVPNTMNLSNLQTPERQAWDSNFEAAMSRLKESGRFKDDGEAKEAAARYADEMARVTSDIANGLDPEKAEFQLKEIDKGLSPETRK